jgi:hypothetical protein
MAGGSRVGQNGVIREKIWEWAKAEIPTEDLNNKLLLAKDDKKQTVWHYAHCGTMYNC